MVVGLLPLCERNHRCRNDESVWWGIVVSKVLLFVMLVCLEWYKGLKQKEKGILIGILNKHVKPTAYESAKFDRNWLNSSEIDAETAYKLALDPSLSY